MRALWTSASSMKAQQLNIDTISNNLANVNTTAFKKQRMEFKDLLYTTMKRSNLMDGEGRPVNLQVGHGVTPVANTRFFSPGGLEYTEGIFDLAIEGDGFFAIETPIGEFVYTRDGSFKVSVEGDEMKLVTSEGYTVLSEFDDEIIIPDGIIDIAISESGLITGTNADGEEEEIGTIKLVKFLNPQGLSAVGRNQFKATAASGEEIPMEDNGRTSRIMQGYLETSNVQVVDEMVRMITAQRAYEISSKTIQTADEMLGMANNLRR